MFGPPNYAYVLSPLKGILNSKRLLDHHFVELNVASEILIKRAKRVYMCERVKERKPRQENDSYIIYVKKS